MDRFEFSLDGEKLTDPICGKCGHWLIDCLCNMVIEGEDD